MGVLAVTGLLGVMVAPADAHQRADLVVTKPAEGASVPGDAVDLVITASPGAALAESSFTITLDGKVVDNTGRLGADSVFTSFSLRAGASLMLRLTPVPLGPHELRIAYERDADNLKPEVVRRFTTAASTAVPAAPAPSTSAAEGSGVPLPLLVIGGLAALGAGVASVLVRRERTQPGA
ncbi:MAG TPA: hypothetical protein VNB94_02295 [Mycobacteriales bacterium]|nr:hypothetical protein [Mycobacteriales bacterium]